MPTPWERNLARDRERLREWLGGKLPHARDLELDELRTPQSSGFSNETLLGELRYRQDGAARREPLVVRIQPTGFQVFPEYDMELQYRTMERLASTPVPVPRVRWLEAEDSEVLGAPFYVMERVEGRVPPDNPTYHQSGWMKELPADAQREIWLGGFDCMARIHRLDYQRLGFGFLDRREQGETPLDRQLAYYRDYLRWAARGLEEPTLEAALGWLEKHRPQQEPTVLCWGDARIGNIIFQGTAPAAVLDWEMVCLGSPEQDVAWQVFLDRHHSEGIETPRLPGLPGYEETLRYYSERSGFPVEHLHYYQVFAGFRFGVIFLRIAQQMGEYGLMKPDVARAFELDNPVTRLLARTLGAPPPTAG